MNRKSIWTWLGEALLIFVSVLGAFWFEDYRHNKQEYQDYLNVLINFRNDVNKDVVDFRYLMDTSLLGGGTYVYLDDYLNRAYDVLTDDTPKNDYQAINIINEGNWFYSDWRRQSEYFDLLSNYSQYLMLDTLHSTIRVYEYVMNLEDQAAEDWKTQILKYQNYIEAKVDLEKVEATSEEITSSIFLKNWVIETRTQNQFRTEFDGGMVARLIKIRTTLDERLMLHEVDSSQLDKEPNKPSFMY
ncbi:MAG: hypothetical protein JXQ90_10375 [Cyclobacteriaceae bacterium]